MTLEGAQISRVSWMPDPGRYSTMHQVIMIAEDVLRSSISLDTQSDTDRHSVVKPGDLYQVRDISPTV